MMKSLLGLVFAMTAAGAAIAGQDPRTRLEAVFAADRAFSSQGAKDDPATAIAAQFADDVVLPQPGGTFIHGRTAATAALRANPANISGIARWEPVGGGVSADGQHAFTYGYMTVGPQGSQQQRYAKYMTYWILGKDGWKAAAYKRAPRPAEGSPSQNLQPVLPTKMVTTKMNARDIEMSRQSLIAAERNFASEAQKIGIGPAFRKFGSPIAVNFGSGAGYIVGNDAIAIAVGEGTPVGQSPVNWGPDEGALVAPSGDLGITFGRIRPNANPQAPGSSFFTIWHRDNRKAPWRYVAE